MPRLEDGLPKLGWFDPEPEPQPPTVILYPSLSSVELYFLMASISSWSSSSWLAASWIAWDVNETLPYYGIVEPRAVLAPPLRKCAMTTPSIGYR